MALEVDWAEHLGCVDPCVTFRVLIQLEESGAVFPAAKQVRLVAWLRFKILEKLHLWVVAVPVFCNKSETPHRQIRDVVWLSIIRRQSGCDVKAVLRAKLLLVAVEVFLFIDLNLVVFKAEHGQQFPASVKQHEHEREHAQDRADERAVGRLIVWQVKLERSSVEVEEKRLLLVSTAS